jgi:hypothetical protein
MAWMTVSSRPSFPVNYVHPLLVAAVVGIFVVVGTIWISSAYEHRGMAGPFVEFEIRLPLGILLPRDRDIEVTFWSGGVGRGCPAIEVRRKIDPPQIVGRCALVADRLDSALSVRFSRFSEGYWKIPINKRAASDTMFGPWQHIEFIRAPAAGGEVSSLPHGEYFFRYLIRS